MISYFPTAPVDFVSLWKKAVNGEIEGVTFSRIIPPIVVPCIALTDGTNTVVAYFDEGTIERPEAAKPGRKYGSTCFDSNQRPTEILTAIGKAFGVEFVIEFGFPLLSEDVEAMHPKG